MKKLWTKINGAYLPILFALLLIIGVLVGYLIQKEENAKPRYLVYPDKEKISEVINYIVSHYVDSVDKEILVETAIMAMLDSLDPHSVYIPAEDLKEVNEPLEGEFSGIGIQFNMQKDTVVVVKTIPKGPSEKVGLMPGDRIIKINGNVVAGKDVPTDEIVSKLKGKKGTKVNVSIKRKGISELIDFEITRDDIPLHSIDVSYMLNNETGYIKISNFSKKTYSEFLEAVGELKDNGMENIILDLRGNGGGYMSAAVNIADEFLENGELIVYTKGKASPRRDIYASKRGNIKEDNIIVLIDEWSASASEILSGAIQDNGRGTIVGRRSFGKGLVQQQIILKDGSALRLTVARYYTPAGRCIQKPYKNGREDYYREVTKRYKHGEFFESDSIQFPDSLKYETADGDTVFGGGGIMPDVFVPQDTTGLSDFYSKVSRRGILYKFCFDYADKHRDELMDIKSLSQFKVFLNNKDIINDFISYSKKKGITPGSKDIKKSREILQKQLQAYIARNIRGDESFYRIIHSIDNTLHEAAEILKNK